MARGPRWVPVRPVAVPSHGAPPMATSICPARRSAGVRQSGSLAKVWMPLQDMSVERLTVIGPAGLTDGGAAEPRSRDPRGAFRSLRSRDSTAGTAAGWRGVPGGRPPGLAQSGIDPRIRNGLQDVHDRVDRDVSDAEQEGHAGYGGEVGGRDTLRHVLADAGPAEY